MRVVYNKDENTVKEIQEQIKKNGGHCLCTLKKTMDTKCMCKDFRDKINNGYFGECACGLYKSIPTIVYICGNTFHTADFIHWNDYFSRQGLLVLMPGDLAAHDQTEIEKNNLKNINEQKIQFADILFVIDKYGKVAEGIDKDIELAKKSGKKILYASEMDD